VVSTRGAIQASPGDRCTVAIDAAPAEGGVATCSMTVTCPRIERHVDVACKEPWEIRDPVLSLHGEEGTLTLVNRVGATERGRAELRIDTWR
jgi:hypothetical protein